jgi:hypothetical protein
VLTSFAFGKPPQGRPVWRRSRHVIRWRACGPPPVECPFGGCLLRYRRIPCYVALHMYTSSL